MSNTPSYNEFLAVIEDIDHEEFMCCVGALGFKFIIEHADEIKTAVARGKGLYRHKIIQSIEMMVERGRAVKQSSIHKICKYASAVVASARAANEQPPGKTIESVLAKYSEGESETPRFAGFMAAARADDLDAFKKWYNTHIIDIVANGRYADVALAHAWQIVVVTAYDAVSIYEFLRTHGTGLDLELYARAYLNVVAEVVGATTAVARMRAAKIFTKFYADKVESIEPRSGGAEITVKK